MTEFVVTNVNDAGAGSLRQAILDANALPGEDRITFAAELSGQEILLSGGELTIADALAIAGDIDGDGTGDITIDPRGSSRAFNIDDGAAASVAVQLSGLTIRGGSTPDNGGGIANAENLTLSNSTVSGNSASGDGGGIFNDLNATVDLSNSILSDNSANFGGGIFNNFNATVDLSNSTVSDNSANGGGGIYNLNATAILSDSTVSDNSASADGGGILNSNATATLSNSTVSGNAANFGGGIFNNLNTTAAFNNSTVARNSANGGGGIFNYNATTTLAGSTIGGNAAELGGGIYNSGNSGTVSAASTLITGNSANGEGGEIFNGTGTIAADANNLFGDDSQTDADAFAGFTPGASDLSATADGTVPTALEDILEITLAANGGPTQTLALVAGSPAIDAGGEIAGLTTDQRGVPRPTGAVDIGAFEAALEATDFSLDTDGNGSTDALGDGLNVLRVLLGAPIAAIVLSPDVPEGVEQGSVFASIDMAAAAGVLDTDRSGSTEALTDGLNILRILLGAPTESIVLGDSAPPDLLQQDVASAIAALL